MPKSRSASLAGTGLAPSGTTTARASLTEGTARAQRSRADRIGKLETLLEQAQQDLAVQFERIAAMQMQLDRLEQRRQRRR